MEEQQVPSRPLGGPRVQYMTHCDECGKRIWSYWESGVLCQDCHEEMITSMAVNTEESES